MDNQIIDFDSLTPAEQRVAVAKDVIRQLDARKYIAHSGSYIVSIKDKNNLYLLDSVIDIKDSFDEILECKVCAMGACIMSITHFKNKLKFVDLQYGEGDYLFHGADKVDNLILSVFSREQLALIEMAFEKNDTYTNYGRDYLKADLSDYDTRRYTNLYWTETQSDRLRLIMQNIVDNDGTFTLE